MPYEYLPQTVRVLQYAPWYRVSELLEAISAIRDCNFNIVEQRQQALERLAKCRIAAPFSLNVRFDGRDDYVCELVGDWARKFQQLKSALSHKERDLRTQIRGQDEKGLLHDSGSISDSQQAFWNATTSMFDQLIKTDGVVDRSTFERKYRLVWQGAAQQQPHQQQVAVVEQPQQ
jgi:hypothetical protein